MLGHSAALLVALATMATVADKEVTSFAHPQWTVGQKFEIRTADRVFRGQLTDRTTGQCQMASSDDGTHFGSLRTVFLLGATAGQQDRLTLVMMREVKVGLRMELGLDDLAEKHRLITSEVQSIRLLD